jgi:hypothetical protein
VNREFELMTPAQLRGYREEVALWDGTLLDGLPDEVTEVVASRGRHTR